MKRFGSLLVTALYLLCLTSDVWAQPSNVPNHAIPIGRGAGVSGWRSILGTDGQVPVGQTGADPIFKTVGGDCTMAAAGTLTCTKTGGVTLGTMATQNANGVAITGGTITGMGTPSASSDVATKGYVDSTATGLHLLAPSKLATAAVLPNTPTYSNGASGVGATLTAGANSTLTVDGTVAALNDIVLVKNQASQFQNGQYYVSTAGSGAAAWVLTRCSAAACGVQFDTAATMLAGSYTLITAGSTNINTSYVLQATVTTVGTTAAVFYQFSSQAASQWTTTGSDIYYNTGKVGIGTATPADQLSVSKNQASSTQVSITNTNASGASGFTMNGPTLLTTLFMNGDGNGGLQTRTPGLFLDAMNSGGTIAMRTGSTPTTRLTINPTGQILVGAGTATSLLTVNDNAASLPTPLSSSTVHVGGANAALAGITVDSFGSGGGNLPYLGLRRASGTAAAPSAVLSGEFLGFLGFYGYGATTYGVGARSAVFGSAAQNWTDSAQGSSLTLWTTPNGTTTPVTAMFIDQDKSITVNKYPSQRLSTTTTGKIAVSTDCLPIEAFGGAASQTWASGTDNVAAWNAFIAAVGTNQACLEFGPGIYFFNSAISATLQGSSSVQPLGQGLTVRGSGMGSSFLYFPNNTNGMGITYGEATTLNSSTFNALDLTFATCAGVGNAAYGIQITGNSSAGNVPRTTLLQNLTFQGGAGCSGEGGINWGVAINMINVQNVDYDHISIWGANQGYTGTGIQIAGGSGGGAATSHRMSHIRSFFIGNVINITGHAEGISVQHSDFVHVDRCFKADVFSGSAQSPEYRYVNSECASRTIGIEWNGVAHGEVAGNLFYNGTNAPSDTTAIALTNTTSMKIHDNHFEGQGSTSRYGITVDSGGSFTNIHDNMFATQSNAVWLKSGTNYGIIRNNLFINGAACTNSGTNSTLSGNILVSGVSGSC